MNQYRTTVKRLVSPKTFWDKAVYETVSFVTEDRPEVKCEWSANFIFHTKDDERLYKNVVEYSIEPLPIFHENAPINQLPRHAVFQIIRDAVRSEMERMAKEEQS